MKGVLANLPDILQAVGKVPRKRVPLIGSYCVALKLVLCCLYYIGMSLRETPNRMFPWFSRLLTPDIYCVWQLLQAFTQRYHMYSRTHL